MYDVIGDMDPMATDNGLVVNNLNHVRTDSQVSGSEAQ